MGNARGEDRAVESAAEVHGQWLDSKKLKGEKKWQDLEQIIPVFSRQERRGVVIGGLVSANLTANLASGELYADDRLAEQISEVISGTIAMETDDMTDEVASIVYGATVTDGQVIYNKDDVPPMGKLAYYKALRTKGINSYRCYYYPQARGNR